VHDAVAIGILDELGREAQPARRGDARVVGADVDERQLRGRGRAEEEQARGGGEDQSSSTSEAFFSV
jgi:hypothetical protein